MTNVAEAAALLTRSRRILIFTGAGVSTESGIPDFRGPNGVWKDVSPSEFTLSRYIGSQERREAGWKRRFDPSRTAFAPNAAHAAIANLWGSGHMVGCITQNIDGLHQKAGLPSDAIAELHGNASGIRCLDCQADAAPETVRARWLQGETDPRCDICSGILKPTVVYFGEALPEQAVETARRWVEVADSIIAIGSTLSV